MIYVEVGENDEFFSFEMVALFLVQMGLLSFEVCCRDGKYPSRYPGFQAKLCRVLTTLLDTDQVTKVTN